VQTYLRPLSLEGTHNMHLIQFVSSPIEMERLSLGSNISAFGTLMPASREGVVLDVYTAAGRLFIDVNHVTVPLPASADALFSKVSWQLLTISIDLTTKAAAAYVDSSLVSSGGIGGGSALLLTEALSRGVTGHAFVGRPRWGAAFVGEVDDFRLLSRPISADQVRFVFQNRNLPVELAEHATLEWRFDELRLRDIIDSSVRGGGDGSVFIQRTTTNADGTTFSTISLAPAVRFDGYAAAKVPSAAGLDASAAVSTRGAISPAIARRSADIDGQPIAQNTSTAIRVIDGRVGRREAMTVVLVPRLHNVTVAGLPRHGSVVLVSAVPGLLDTPLTLGQRLTSSAAGEIHLAYTASSTLRASPSRADTISFASFSLPAQSSAAMSGDVGFLLKWVSQLKLIMLVNEIPFAPAFHSSLQEDTIQRVLLGAFGDVAVSGRHFQADTEGQTLSANITVVPTRGKLYQADATTLGADGTLRGKPILQSDVPVTLTGSRNQLVYVPPADVSGAGIDFLTYTLADDVGARSRPANITFDIVSVHDAPTPGACNVGGGGINSSGSVQLSRLTSSQQSAELAWVGRSCAGLCEPEVVRVAEDGSIDFKLIINSKEDSLVMVDMVSAPFHGKLYQLMTSSRNQNSQTAPKREVDLSAARSAELTVWAHEVVGASSQRSTGASAWAATSTLGLPDVYPAAGDSTQAWSPGGKLSAEWIELEFGERLYVTSIQIYETWFPGHVTRVSFRHPDGTWIPAWKGSVSHSDAAAGASSRVFAPLMCAIPFPTSQVRLDLSISTFGVLTGGVFPQIDAVLLSGTWTPPPRRLLFTPGPSDSETHTGESADGSSEWGVAGGTGSGGTGTRRDSGTVGQYSATGGSGRALEGLVQTPRPAYWLRYVPSKDFSGVDRLVFATNDCDWDREFRGVVLPCQEVALRVLPSNDPPELLNPWGLDPKSAAGGLLGTPEAINATIVAISKGSGTGGGPGSAAGSWKLSVRLKAAECTGAQEHDVLLAVRKNVTSAFSSAAQAQLAGVLGECGISFMLRSRDPDVDDRSTTFVALSAAKNGVQVVSRPLPASTVLSLRVDAASYSGILAGTEDFVTACSILDTSAQAAAAAAAAGSATPDAWQEDAFVRSQGGTLEGRRTQGTSYTIDSSSTGNGVSTGLGAQGDQAAGVSTTLEDQRMTAAVVSYVPKIGICGSAAETLLFWASDTGVSDLYGAGGQSGVTDSLASSVLRAVIDVECAPGTRKVTEEGAVAIAVVASVSTVVILLGIISYGVCWARGVSLIKRAQPIVTLLAGLGSLVLVGAVLLELLPPSPGLCDAKRAVQSFGFILAFGAPAAKVFRVFRLLIKIHLNTSLNRVAFPESALLLVLASLVVMEGLYAGAWSAISPTRLTPLADPGEPMITHLRCDGPAESVFFGGWALLHLALVAFTLYLSAITRNVHYQRGESRWIGYTIYLQSLCTVGGIVLYMALEGRPQVQTLAACLVVLFAAMVAPVFMLMRRTALAMGVCEFSRTYDMAVKNNRSRTKSSSMGSSTGPSPGGANRSTRGSRASDPGVPQATLTRASEASQGPPSMAPGRGRMVSRGSFNSVGAHSSASTKDRKHAPGSAIRPGAPANILSFGSARDFLSTFTSEHVGGGAGTPTATNETAGSRQLHGTAVRWQSGHTVTPRAVGGSLLSAASLSTTPVASSSGASKRVAPAPAEMSQPMGARSPVLQGILR